MCDVLDQENSDKSGDTYDHFFGAEVCLPSKLEKNIYRVTKPVKDNEGITGGIEQPTLFADNSLYEVSFSNGKTGEHQGT